MSGEVVPFVSGGAVVVADDPGAVVAGGNDSALVVSDPGQAFANSFGRELANVGITDARVMEATLPALVAALGARDPIDKAACEKVLRPLWGPDYAANLRLIKGLTAQLPGESAEALLDARGPDGKAILNDPSIVELLAKLARGQAYGYEQTYRDPGVVTDIDRRLAEIENVMRTNRSAYNKDESLQAEYRRLLAQKGGR